MDADAKKTALRMIPYGLYILTAESKDGKIAASTVNWVTQTAFQPPLVVVGVKADSGAHSIIKESKSFALNILGKDQKGQAFTFLSRSNERVTRSAARLFAKGLWAPRFSRKRLPLLNARSWIRWKKVTIPFLSAK